jgi:hypothetical protein
VRVTQPTVRGPCEDGGDCCIPNLSRSSSAAPSRDSRQNKHGSDREAAIADAAVPCSARLLDDHDTLGLRLRCWWWLRGLSLHWHPALSIPVELAVGRDLGRWRWTAHGGRLLAATGNSKGQIAPIERRTSAGGLLGASRSRRPDRHPMLTVLAMHGALLYFEAVRTCSIAVTATRTAGAVVVDPQLDFAQRALSLDD